MNSVPFFERRMFGIMWTGAVFKACDACIVYDHVHIGIREEEAFPVALARHVEFDEGRAKRPCQAFACFNINVANHDARAFLDEHFGYSAANSACASGDEGNFVLQSGHGTVS